MLVLVVFRLVSEKMGGGEKEDEESGEVAPDELSEALANVDVDDWELVDGRLPFGEGGAADSVGLDESTTAVLETATGFACEAKYEVCAGVVGFSAAGRCGD